MRWLVVSFLLHVAVGSGLGKWTTIPESNPTSIQVEYRSSPQLGSSLPNLEPMRSSPVKSQTAQLLGARTSGESATVQGSAVGIRVKYPRLSRVLGEDGRVLIEIQKNNKGDVGTQIVLSSGYTRIDQAALTSTQAALSQGILREHLQNRNNMVIGFVFKLCEQSTAQQ